ncbi:MAG: DUF1232 domain-containing protein [Candidatus Dojkabacteria bacterium]|nr:DUF1232 domain-containing protein [Candidatus Dojkabacteria bacterium]
MQKLKQFFKENWVLILSLIYIISPIDIIPGDLATGIGLIDDLGVLLFTTIYLLVRFIIDNKEDKESL